MGIVLPPYGSPSSFASLMSKGSVGNAHPKAEDAPAVETAAVETAAPDDPPAWLTQAPETMANRIRRTINVIDMAY